MICVSVAVLGSGLSLRACAVSVFLSWLPVTFFWSVPGTSLSCHWPWSFFLDFVMVRGWKCCDEAPRWLMFKTRSRRGSPASSSILFFLPAVHRERFPGCGWMLCLTYCVVVHMVSFKPGLFWKELAALDATTVSLAQKYLFFLLQASK